MCQDEAQNKLRITLNEAVFGPYSVVRGVWLEIVSGSMNNPKGPHAARLRTLVPKAIPSVVFLTRVLKWALYGPFWATTD